MPGRDNTGPAGLGAKTGRGMGTCSGADVTVGRGMGAGRGMGSGRGMRCGGGRSNSYAMDQEVTMLRHEVEMLKDKLNS